MKIILLSAAITMLSQQAHAQVVDRVCKEIPQGNDRGWLLYEEPKILCEDVVEDKPLPAPPAPEPKKPVKKVEKKPEPEKQQPAQQAQQAQNVNFSTKWLRENFDKYVDLAVDNPTPENVRAVFLLQKIATARAEKFQLEARKVVMSDSLLDAENERPINTQGINAFEEQAEVMRAATINKIKEKGGIFFFYRSDCPYCKRQAQVLNMLKMSKGVSVMAISLDGQPLPVEGFENYKIDQGQAEKMKVQQVPALYFVTPGMKTEYFPISQGGVLAQESVEKRMIVGALNNDLITDKEYYASIGIRKNEKADITKLAQREKLQVTEKDGFIPPSEINRLIEEGRK